jgi:DNA-binding winged helix-turn-helix (wHTH) protein
MSGNPVARLRFGPCEIRTDSGELWRDGLRVPIQRQPFELLALLVREPGRVFAREELYSHLWPAGTFVDFEHGLNTCMRKLRRVLRDAPQNPHFIGTVPGRGYRFLAAVESLPVATSRPGDDSPTEAEHARRLLVRPPFVGRDGELTRLARRLGEAAGGHGGLVLVAGEPGIGKTRLLEELRERASDMASQVLAGRCVEGDGSAPYGPIAEALTRWVHQAPAAELREVADEGIWSVAAKLVPVVRTRLPDLGSAPSLRPDEERLRLLDAIGQIAAGIAKRSCLLFVLDDLHWADAGTLALLSQLSRGVSSAPLLIVGAFRDVEVGPIHPLALHRDTFAREPGFEQLTLTGLGSEPVRAWLERVSQGRIEASVADDVLRATDGNPFFVRELLLEWDHAGTLAAGVRADAGAIAVPQNVRAMVGRRLARLSAPANQLLAYAAAFPATFHFEPVAQAAGLDEDKALDALDELHEAQLVRSSGGPDDYEFVHALIRMVAHEAATPARRVRIHRRLAQELEREVASGGPDRSAAIAEHYHASRELPGAAEGARHALAAAGGAEAVGDLEGAARFLRLALDLMGDADPRLPGVSARLARTLCWAARPDDAVQAAHAAADLLERTAGREAAADFLVDVTVLLRHEHRRHAWAVGARAFSLLGTRRDLAWARIAGLERFERAATEPDAFGMPYGEFPDRLLAARLLRSAEPGAAAGTSCFFESREDAASWPPDPLIIGFVVGDYRASAPMFRIRAEQSLREGRFALAALEFGLSARMELALGDLPGAEQRFTEALRLYERAGRPATVLGQLVGVPFERAAVTDTGFDALASVYETIVENPPAENRWMGAPLWIAAAYSHCRLGDPARACDYLARCAAAIERSPGWEINYPFLIHWAAATAWELEDSASAGRIASNIRDKLVSADFRYPNTDLRLSLGRMRALGGCCDEAVEWFAAARAALDGQGARPLRAITDLDEALMYVRRGARGDAARARRLLDAAVPQFQAIGMPGWIERARRLRP